MATKTAPSTGTMESSGPVLGICLTSAVVVVFPDPAVVVVVSAVVVVVSPAAAEAVMVPFIPSASWTVQT
jgi:hypothetical protein